jgi:transposase
LVPVVERLKTRFGIGSVCIVADRGMISAATLAEVEKRNWKYILGVRMRSSTEAKAVVARGGRYAEVHPKSDDPDDPSPLKVKEVWVEDQRRYVVCLNEDQATKDRFDRQAVVVSLQKALGQGDKSLVGNKGYRKFLRPGGKQFAIDEDKIQEEARYDGKWVLTTNTDLPAREVALKYKQLWMVEDVFRSMKSLLDTRPIYHQCDETIRGHVFCSFLALLLRQELEQRLTSKQWKLEWADVIRDLDNLVEMEIAIGGKSYVIRGHTTGVTGKVFQACGVALPPTLRSC